MGPDVTERSCWVPSVARRNADRSGDTDAMPSLGAFSPLRHIAVGGAAAAIGVASLTGVIGEERSERFDSKQVVVSPSGTDGLHVTEVVDIDFGDHQRHGYERIIPDDFGVPIEVTADSPDAPDEVTVESIGDGRTRIRIGDPDTTVSGQHRYVLEYTYPRANLASGEIALNIIDAGEKLETTRFEVVVTGFELTNLRCNAGPDNTEGGCEFTPDGDLYRAVIEPLEAGDGVTIGATVLSRREVVAVPPPPLPKPKPNRRAPLGAGTTLLGAATGGGIYTWARRRGRNEVFSGGAADAAYGVPSRSVPPPGSGLPLAPPPAEPSESSSPPTGTRLVADERMSALATIEFVPPTGVEPWLGNVLLSEQITNDTVTAWISGAAARDYLSIVKNEEGDVVLSTGPRLDEAADDEQKIMRSMLGTDGSITLGKYSKSFSAAWVKIKKRETTIVDGSGFWKRPLSGAGGFAAAFGTIGLVILIFGGLLLFEGPARGFGMLDHPVVALVIAVGVPAILGFVVYGSLLPSRTAEGSALTLRTESFRRFLAASEGEHVEWAWKHGLLREYSAWAVALGTAKAWEKAMQHSNVPPAEYLSGPMVVYMHAGSFSSTHTAPSSSGSGAGGGFSGGSVGGGGGGGSSGSW